MCNHKTKPYRKHGHHTRGFLFFFGQFLVLDVGFVRCHARSWGHHGVVSAQRMIAINRRGVVFYRVII